MKKIGDVAGSNADVNGEWTAGNPQGGIPATILMAEYLNTVQRELVEIAQHNGGTLDPNNDAQLVNAIRLIGQPAGSVSLMGQIEKGVGDTLNLPEGQVNIGGNGLGFVLLAQTNWDPTATLNHDGSVAALALGDDVYIYAVQDVSGVAKWLASKNATVPTGYTASNSRKLGGFHFGRVRPVANRYDTVYVPAVQIVPNSCWDLQHRPKCDPSGMVEVIPGSLWVDIYLASAGSGLWPQTVAQSVYNQAPLRSAGGYSESDLRVPLLNAGKRIATVEEFLYFAEGAPAGLSASNDQAWTQTTNVGPTTTGYVAKAVSMYNVVDAVGNIWERLDSHFDLGGTHAWDNLVVNVGQDSTIPRGYVHHAAWRTIAGGGGYVEGYNAGARCIGTNDTPWSAIGNLGIRGVCDAV